MSLSISRTRVSISDEQNCRVAGQTLWGGVSSDGEAGVAWDWIEMPRGLVAMADPMCVVTNIRLVGDEGEVLTAFEAARHFNWIVHALPWQHEVERALSGPGAGPALLQAPNPGFAVLPGSASLVAPGSALTQ